VEPRRRPTPDEVAFTNTYRHLRKRHGLSWAIGLAGAALGVPMGANTVYACKENEPPDTKRLTGQLPN
jgi:hypothetical protein